MFLIPCESAMSVAYGVNIPPYITYYILPNTLFRANLPFCDLGLFSFFKHLFSVVKSKKFECSTQYVEQQ